MLDLKVKETLIFHKWFIIFSKFEKKLVSFGYRDLTKPIIVKKLTFDKEAEPGYRCRRTDTKRRTDKEDVHDQI